MIFYFSAEGNSRYVAGRLGERLGEEVTDIADLDFDFANLGKYSGEILVIVSPVYSWGLPVPVKEFLHTLRPWRGYAYGVLTCGDDTGMAHRMLVDEAAKSGVKIAGVSSIQMPNTYVILPGFDVDSDERRDAKLKAAPARIAEIADAIAERRKGFDVVTGGMPKLKTSLIYPLFLRYGINPSKFRTTDTCSGCGQCAASCPLKNITLNADKRPEWGKNCVSCLKCYHICARHAIQYGQITRHKGQYYLHKNELSD